MFSLRPLSRVHEYSAKQSCPPRQKREEARIALERKEKKWQKEHAYDDIFSEENMENSSNQNRDADWEDDFM